VTTGEGVVAMLIEHRVDSMGGEKELLWRCWQCCALEPIETMPDTCPDCGAPGEELYFWRED
jgi:rubrerythrin